MLYRYTAPTPLLQESPRDKLRHTVGPYESIDQLRAIGNQVRQFDRAGAAAAGFAGRGAAQAVDRGALLPRSAPARRGCRRGLGS